MVLVHPMTVFPIKLLTTAQIIAAKLISETKIPSAMIIRIGLTERLVIPSKASDTIFPSG